MHLVYINIQIALDLLYVRMYACTKYLYYGTLSLWLITTVLLVELKRHACTYTCMIYVLKYYGLC